MVVHKKSRDVFLVSPLDSFGSEGVPELLFESLSWA